MAKWECGVVAVPRGNKRETGFRPELEVYRTLKGLPLLTDLTTKTFKKYPKLGVLPLVIP